MTQPVLTAKDLIVLNDSHEQFQKYIENKPELTNAVQTSTGRTLLHWACTKPNYVQHIETLMQNGADIKKKDKNGKTPLQIAENYLKSDSKELALTQLNSKSQHNRSDFALNSKRSPGIFGSCALEVGEKENFENFPPTFTSNSMSS